MTCAEELFEAVYVAFPWGSSLPVASGYFTIQNIPWYTMVLQSGNMSCPSVLILQWNSFNAVDLGLFRKFSVCDEDTETNVGDGA